MPIDIDEQDLQVWIRPTREKGPSEYPHFNEALQSELHQLIDGACCHIYNIDKQIHEYRDGLRLLQPHGSGRMDIRYWQSKVPGRHPTPFLWKGLPAGHSLPLKRGQKMNKNRSLIQRTSRAHLYTAQRIPMKGLVLQLKRRGKFRDTLNQVKEVVREVQSLLNMRATIFESIRRFRISLNIAIERQHSEICRMVDEAEKKKPAWRAEFERRYDELAARKSAHLLLLEEEEKRLARRGYQFGTMPTGGA